MIPVFRPVVHPAARARALGCLESGWLGYGPLCRELEARFIGHRDGWALATSSCTAALSLAGRLVTAPGRFEVIVPAITYVSTAMAFAAAGLDVLIAEDRKSVV